MTSPTTLIWICLRILLVGATRPALAVAMKRLNEGLHLGRGTRGIGELRGYDLGKPGDSFTADAKNTRGEVDKNADKGGNARGILSVQSDAFVELAKAWRARA